LRREAPPTATVYDAKVEWPQALRVAASACNVADPQTWYLTVSLLPSSGATEVYFTLTATLEDSTRPLGDTVSGFVCCHQYKYYAFEGVDERRAPSVDFNLSSGQLKAIYWRYDSCPIENQHVVSGSCLGWCVLDWYRLFSGNLGLAKFRSKSTLTVPYGMGEAPDKRRGGRWYLGVQALEGPAEYTAKTTELGPPPLVDTGCNRLDRYCPPEHREDRYRDMGTRTSGAFASTRRQRANWRMGSSCLLIAALCSSTMMFALERPTLRRAQLSTPYL